ncbi:MAG: 4-(cytidine 5'-diphospho)-2-C-methyl-D-erythritol kinase [Lachnospiraceae bacterium]|nr:4-(cytidine 5'-diphospho)-2-C-methyl-D-erythritol kinase [Lachnospiraceae bacterium]
MDSFNCKARAKINLGLDVCRRLENGYHEVKMVMQTVDIYDELILKKREDADIVLLINSGDDLGTLEDNLIYRAAKRMREHYDLNRGIEIYLKKNIPVAAGMAGGSADAAATMLGINELFSLGKSKEELMELALPLGADIPFCIMGGTALAEGIGEKLTPLPAPPDAVLVVVKPPIMVSTGKVYQSLDLKELKKHPDIDGIAVAIRNGDLNGIVQRMENVMETVTEVEFPIITDIKRMMTGNGALNAMMSGSGPSIFGVFMDKTTATDAAEYVRRTLQQRGMDAQVYVTTFYNEGVSKNGGAV